MAFPTVAYSVASDVSSKTSLSFSNERRKIWNLSDSHGIRTNIHLVWTKFC